MKKKRLFQIFVALGIIIIIMAALHFLGGNMMDMVKNHLSF